MAKASSSPVEAQLCIDGQGSLSVDSSLRVFFPFYFPSGIAKLGVIPPEQEETRMF